MLGWVVVAAVLGVAGGECPPQTLATARPPQYLLRVLPLLSLEGLEGKLSLLGRAWRGAWISDHRLPLEPRGWELSSLSSGGAG